MGKGGWSTKPVGEHVELDLDGIDEHLDLVGWSRRELARQATRVAEGRGEKGISAPYMQQLLAGQVPCDERKLGLIADALRIPPRLLTARRAA